MSRRSRDAWRLSRLLEQRAGCRVEVRWGSDGRPWAWWVAWIDGPTEGQMRSLAAELAGEVRSLDVGTLIFWRGLFRRAWAVQLVRYVSAGGDLRDFEVAMLAPGLARERFRQQVLDTTPHPARAADTEEGKLAEALTRLAEPYEERLWELMRTHGLAALVADNVEPLAAKRAPGPGGEGNYAGVTLLVAPRASERPVEGDAPSLLQTER
jgi:hypothetical protein